MQDIIMDLQDTLRHSQKQLEEEMNARLRDQEEFVMEKAKLERKAKLDCWLLLLFTRSQSYWMTYFMTTSSDQNTSY